MVVCKYFLQGTCKFGTYCNYEHQAPSNYTSFTDSNRQSASILRQANFGAVQTQNTKPSGSSGNVDVNTLVKSVVNDMIGAEKGGQWLLSCYAPFKEKPAFPGFDDQSPEEIRFGFYEAQKNGTMEQYKTQLQALLQNIIIRVKALQNPAQDVVAVLQTIYNTPPSSCSGTFGQNVVTASMNNLNQQNTFPPQTQNKSIFGQSNDNIFKTNNQPTNTNIFASGSPQNNFNSWQQNQGQTNLFGNVPSSTPPNQNIFGANTYGKTQNSMFGQQGSDIFANSSQTPSSSTNIFASQALPVSSQSSVFGGAQAQSAQQPTNIFATAVPPNQNLFSSQNINQQQSLFGQQPPQPNIFATATNESQNMQSQNIFSAQLQNQQQQQNMFSGNTNATQFSNSQPSPVQSAPPSYSASIFGYSANLNNPSIGMASASQQPIDENLYSKLGELTDEERKWFESDTLDIMNIPDKPPTYDMCFKV